MPTNQPNSGNQGGQGQGRESDRTDNSHHNRILEGADGGVRKSLDYQGPVQNPKEPPTTGGGTKRPGK